MSAGFQAEGTPVPRAPARRLPPLHRHALPDARRADQERLLREIRTAGENPIVRALLTAVDAMLLVLNAERQIIAFNSRIDGVAHPADLIGLRPGEALGCVNACGPAGCGSSPPCETCGSLGAILVSQAERRPIEAECVMRTQAGATLDLNVRATPVVVDGARFTILSLRDVSSEKRRLELEQIFFHDVLNTVTGLRGWAEQLRSGQGDLGAAAERVERLSHHLEREIRDHRTLVLAERGTLVPEPERFPSTRALRDLETFFATHAVARGRQLELQGAQEVALDVDPSLLLRVLVNMVRNAFEATGPGGTVRVRCERVAGGADGGERVRFDVWNAGAMPPEVQQHVFQRSFSTKARHGRGLGTFSMKLLGERYLGGRVSFASTEQEGTTFTFELPLRGASAAEPARVAAPRRRAERRDRPQPRVRVLVVEDDPDVRESLVQYLVGRSGHDVVAAHDGEAALEKARTWRPDVVLCDVALPGVDGYAFARAARGTPSLDGTRLVAMTGSTSDADRSRAHEAGFDHHLAKPLDLDALELVLAGSTARG